MVISILISMIFALIRMSGVRNDIFKDFAHIWVGILIGYGYFYQLIILSIIEVICFFIYRKEIPSE